MWSSELPGVAGRSWLNTAHQGPLPVAPHLFNTREQIAAAGELLDVS